jgi:hypothetical protein
MSFPNPPHLERRRAKNPNKLDPDKLTMNAISTLLITSKGWLLRQALKLTGGALASFSAYAYSKAETLGVDPSQVQTVLDPLAAAISAGVVLLIELGLSYLARKNR